MVESLVSHVLFLPLYFATAVALPFFWTPSASPMVDSKRPHQKILSRYDRERP